MKNKIVAIHQPNFFPWLGFFNKYIKSDVFIIGDSFQIPKTDGSYTNRVLLILNNKIKWLTLPINRNYKGIARIRDIMILKDDYWINKTLRTIQMSYGKAPYYDEVSSYIEELLLYRTESLVEFNVNVLYSLLDKLKLGTEKLILQSNIGLDHLWKINLNDYIIEMVKSVDGDIYLSGDGSGGYQDEQKFLEAKMGIEYTNYKHPSYNQFNQEEFIPCLSIIDVLMNLGFSEVENLLKNKSNVLNL